MGRIDRRADRRRTRRSSSAASSATTSRPASTSSRRCRAPRRGRGRSPRLPVCVRDSWRPERSSLPGKSKDPDFDIYQLQTPQTVTETAFSGRFDWRFNLELDVVRPRLPRPGAPATRPTASSGRVIHTEANPSNAILNLQGLPVGPHHERVQVRLQRRTDAAAGQRPVIPSSRR